MTLEQVEEIRALKESDLLQKDIAVQYGVSPAAIYQIWNGISFIRAVKLPRWTAEQDETLRQGLSEGQNFSQIARKMGKTCGPVRARAIRIGLTGNYNPHAPRKSRVQSL